MLIGISGKARAGKDTLYEIYGKPRGYEQASFACALKYRIRDSFELSLEHTDGVLKEVNTAKLNFHTPRELMIDYGNLIRKYNPDFWCQELFRYIDERKAHNFMITDVRYPNEARFIKDRGGLLIRLERHEDRDGLVAESTKMSISETALDDYKEWDLVLPASENKIPEDLMFFGSKIDGLILEKAK